MNYLNPHTHDLSNPEGVTQLTADVATMGRTADVLDEIAAERTRQDIKWGVQRHPDGTGRPGDAEEAERLRALCKANGPGQDNWRDILAEEIGELFAETDPRRIREEAVQAAAVLVNWIETLDERTASDANLNDPCSPDCSSGWGGNAGLSRAWADLAEDPDRVAAWLAEHGMGGELAPSPSALLRAFAADLAAGQRPGGTVRAEAAAS